MSPVKGEKWVLPFKVPSGAGAVSGDLVHLVDTLAVLAFGVPLLAVVLRYVAEKTLWLLLL